MLLQELVEESSKSDHWAVEKLDAEARRFDEVERTEAGLQRLREVATAYVTVAAEFAINRVSQVEGYWKSSLAILSNKSIDENAAVILLQSLLKSFESSLTMIQSVLRQRPKIAAALRTEQQWPKRFEELDHAERRLLEMASDAKKSLQHRTAWRQPSDPDRLAEGLELARQGKVVSADEVRARYCRSQD
jgi:hypothetical protein